MTIDDIKTFIAADESRTLELKNIAQTLNYRSTTDPVPLKWRVWDFYYEYAEE